MLFSFRSSLTEADGCCEDKQIRNWSPLLLFQSIMSEYPKVRAAIAAADTSFEILDRKPDVPADGHLCPQHLEGSVEFRNVSFSYSGKTDASDLVLKVRTERILCSQSLLPGDANCPPVLPSSGLAGRVFQAEARQNNRAGGQKQLRKVHLC